MRPPKKMSAAAARRLRADMLATKNAEPDPLSAHLQADLDAFAPKSLNEAEWTTVRPVLSDIMRRSKIRGRSTFPQHLSDVTLYLAWCLRNDKVLTVSNVLDHTLIEEWVRAALADLDHTTRTTRRGRLRSLASHINPGPTAPPRAKPIARTSVKPPYGAPEIAAIDRLARTQPTPRLRRQLCAMVGLGAGLDSNDLRRLERRHIEDDGADGIWIDVPGDRPRGVMVRRSCEEILRIGLEGLAPGDLVLGRDADRRNVTAGIVFDAVALGDAPHIEQTRLRSTWLVTLMQAPVPLSVLLASAGLTTARTLTDLLPYALAEQPDQTGRAS